MLGHLLNLIPFPSKVFKKLAWQLNGIPLHTIEARHSRLMHIGKNMVQAMSEFMKKCGYLVMG